MGQINYREEVSLSELFDQSGLNIPEYQRPYKWERRYIRNLYYDVWEAIKKQESTYRLGSVILHRKNNGELDIVDGQQRLISIALFLLVYEQNLLPIGANNLLTSEYQETSQSHARENYREWLTLYGSITKTEQACFHDYLMKRCNVSVIEMPDDGLSEAFQLFDSQNNRGKKLAPHDLLKAYHLRAIGEAANEQTVEQWEQFNNVANVRGQLSLEKLFNQYLFRLRRWSKGETGLVKRQHSHTRDLIFNEKFIDDFKGVNLKTAPYPYLALYAQLDTNGLTFPNSLDMPIINGNAFFKYVEYSYEMINRLFYENNISEDYLPNEAVKYVISKRNSLAKIINLYQNLLALFIDRFGEASLNQDVCSKVFVWAFYLRVVSARIFDATEANYAAGGRFQHRDVQKLFQVLNSATTPSDFVAKIDMDAIENYTIEDLLAKLDGQEGGVR